MRIYSICFSFFYFFLCVWTALYLILCISIVVICDCIFDIVILSSFVNLCEHIWKLHQTQHRQPANKSVCMFLFWLSSLARVCFFFFFFFSSLFCLNNFYVCVFLMFHSTWIHWTNSKFDYTTCCMWICAIGVVTKILLKSRTLEMSTQHYMVNARNGFVFGTD